MMRKWYKLSTDWKDLSAWEDFFSSTFVPVPLDNNYLLFCTI